MPEKLTSDQIALLWSAAQSPLISPEQRLNLTPSNPYLKTGRVAEALQTEVAKLNPEQARAWAEEAGASLSLAAAAAQQGLAELTPELQRELARLQPVTAEEQQKAEIESILAAGNPFAAETRSITACLRLSELMPPGEIEKLKGEAPEPTGPTETAEMQAARAASVSHRPTGVPSPQRPLWS